MIPSTPPPVLPVNIATFKALFPCCRSSWAEAFLPYFNAACLEHDITTGRRLAAFAAQLGHESIDLTAWEEKASGAAYDTGRLAERLGNTPEADGDGQRYKGRGPMQLTGQANYEAAGKALGVDLVAQPERAAHRDMGFRIAGWYWGTRKLNSLADQGPSHFDQITKLINGGLNGADDRRQRYARALALLRCN